ncbi:MAG TPA: hypothetical protein DEG43_06165 [Acidimicrobiaceae bacterium]|jgi:DNA-binding transcriptional MerR regulator|nr:hypothetical protein [Acidimicrobiaceae bacterium]
MKSRTQRATNDSDSVAESDPATNKDISPGLTLDELAAETGVPQRTIRFYQAERLIPKPGRDRVDARIARYDTDHIDRLRLVADLQDRGLKIPAIRELLASPEAPNKVNEWLGLDSSLRGSWAKVEPQLVSREELESLTHGLPRGTRGRLEAGGLMRSQGDSWLILNRPLFELSTRLVRDGVDIDLVLASGVILAENLGRAADRLIDLFVGAVAEGFGEGTEVDSLVETLRPIAGDAAALIFGAELNRAVGALLADTKRLAKLRTRPKS